MAVTTIGVSGGPLILLIPHRASALALVVLVAAQLIYGCSISIFNVNAITLRQVLTPMRLLARMNRQRLEGESIRTDQTFRQRY